MPTRRQEPWRCTDLERLTSLDPASLAAADPRPLASLPAPTPLPDCLRLRLDGSGDPLEGVPLPEGLTALSQADLPLLLGRTLEASGCQDHWPVLLNQATASRLLALRVRGRVAPTLELVSDAVAGGRLLPLRLLLLLEDGASLSLLQVHRSSAANLSSLVLEAELGRNARLEHGLLARGHSEAVLLAHLAVRQQPGSMLRLTTATAGWGLSRLEPRIQQPQGQACSQLRGLQLARGRQLADTHSRVEFLGPEGRLDQLHKVVADEAGRSVFHGAVRVPRAAQRTDATQLSRSLLLSDRARIDTKPELEIVADDVRCSHGATVSRLRQDELFYLQSRGISADQAASLLLRGYAQEILEQLPAAATAWQPLISLQEEPSER